MKLEVYVSCWYMAEAQKNIHCSKLMVGTFELHHVYVGFWPPTFFSPSAAITCEASIFSANGAGMLGWNYGKVTNP